VEYAERECKYVCHYLLGMMNCQRGDIKLSAHVNLGEISKKHAGGHFLSALVVLEELLGDIALYRRT